MSLRFNLSLACALLLTSCEVPGPDGEFYVLPRHVAVGAHIQVAAGDSCGDRASACTEGGITDLRIEVDDSSVFEVLRHYKAVEAWAELKALSAGKATVTATITRAAGTRYTKTTTFTAAPLAGVEFEAPELHGGVVFAPPKKQVTLRYSLLDRDGKRLDGSGLEVCAVDGEPNTANVAFIRTSETPGETTVVTSAYHDPITVETLDPEGIELRPSLDLSPLSMRGGRREMTARSYYRGQPIHPGDHSASPVYRTLTPDTCELSSIESAGQVHRYLNPRALGTCELKVSYTDQRDAVFPVKIVE